MGYDERYLQTKYVTPSFIARLMDKWHQYAQDNKSVKEYVAKFDEFSSNVVPSTLRNKLKPFLDSESDLEKTYELNCYLEESTS